MTDSNNVLATNLRVARARTGLSQERLAILANVDRSIVSAIENERGNPTHQTICALAAALAVTPAWLYTELPR